MSPLFINKGKILEAKSKHVVRKKVCRIPLKHQSALAWCRRFKKSRKKELLSHIVSGCRTGERERGRWGKGEKWQEKVFVIQAKQQNTRGRADGEDLQLWCSYWCLSEWVTTSDGQLMRPSNLPAQLQGRRAASSSSSSSSSLAWLALSSTVVIDEMQDSHSINPWRGGCNSTTGRPAHALIKTTGPPGLLLEVAPLLWPMIVRTRRHTGSSITAYSRHVFPHWQN